ncbi:dTDP-4-dehydrorhamnose reductase [soil metagenome]
MDLKTILVTGAGGQVASELKVISKLYNQYHFIFADKQLLPVDDFEKVETFFSEQPIDFCINCAAYTAVDKAETEKEKAFLINGEAAGHLAKVCKQHATKYIHISTDYVLNGTGTQPYKENHPVDPVNTYGASKLKGEQLVFENNPEAVIIRTSWVFSSFGNNFVKTMIRLMKERECINVVNDQKGSPTYAADLADVIMKVVTDNVVLHNRIYNYCNEGETTWYDFALKIKELTKSPCQVNGIPSEQFPTPAKRPHYSVLDTTLIQQQLRINIPNWKDALERCITLL